MFVIELLKNGHFLIDQRFCPFAIILKKGCLCVSTLIFGVLAAGNKQFQHPLGLRLNCFKRFKWNMNYHKIFNVSNNFFMNRVLKKKSHVLAYFKVNEFAQQNT